jgi:hypothetical protein
MDHETYIWEEFQAETTSFIGGKCFSILGFWDFFGISGFFRDFLGLAIPKIRRFPLGSIPNPHREIKNRREPFFRPS